MTDRLLLDFRAGAPWSPAASAAWNTAASTAWADPGHRASEGRRAAIWRDAAAGTIAGALDAGEVHFFADRDTATEAVLASLHPLEVHLSATHRRAVAHLAALHADAVRTHPVGGNGLPLDPSAHGAIALVQHGNDETGAIETYGGAGLRVIDATNAVARAALPPDWDVLIADSASWGAPSIGIVAIRQRGLLAMLPSFRWRHTPHVALIAAAVEGFEPQLSALGARSERQRQAIDAFVANGASRIPGFVAHLPERHLAHMLSFSIAGFDAEALATALDARGIVVGAASACANDGTPSHVLAEMGVATEGNLRIALPVDAPEDAMQTLTDALLQAMDELRG